MKFTSTAISGAYLIDPEPKGDDRGFFARMVCQREFAEHRLETQFVQMNNSLSRVPGTLRGMHYQLEPHAEVKLVRCIQGALVDVICDLRPDSPSFGQHLKVELTADNRRQFYIPKGCAHGFYTLVPDTEILYLVSAFYAPEHERGLRFDDPFFNIDWPGEPAIVSPRDLQHKDFSPPSPPS